MRTGPAFRLPDAPSVCPASVGNHVKVLEHLAGYLKDALDGGDKAELQTGIDGHRQRRALRLVAVTLLRHYLRRAPQPWATAQTYLNPDPRQQLLNHS